MHLRQPIQKETIQNIANILPLFNKRHPNNALHVTAIRPDRPPRTFRSDEVILINRKVKHDIAETAPHAHLRLLLALTKLASIPVPVTDYAIVEIIDLVRGMQQKLVHERAADLQPVETRVRDEDMQHRSHGLCEHPLNFRLRNLGPVALRQGEEDRPRSMLAERIPHVDLRVVLQGFDEVKVAYGVHFRMAVYYRSDAVHVAASRAVGAVEQCVRRNHVWEGIFTSIHVL